MPFGFQNGVGYAELESPCLLLKEYTFSLESLIYLVNHRIWDLYFQNHM